MTEEQKQICIQRAAECRLESQLLSKRLHQLGYANWITVLIPSLLGLIAGSAIFATDKWTAMIGGATLTAALLTAIHKGLDCDAYQNECRRLIQAYSGLATRYRTLHEVQKDNGLDDFLKLENRLAELMETATIELPSKSRSTIQS